MENDTNKLYLTRDPESEKKIEDSAFAMYSKAIENGQSRELALRYITHIMAKCLDDIANMGTITYN